MESVYTTHPRQYRVHKILAHSYIVYFILFLISVSLDIFLKIRIFSSPAMISLGILLLVIASLLILWAQKSSRNLDTKNVTKESFSKGPYRYTRHPTHWGLFFLMLGFGLMANAFFVIVFTLVAFLVTKFIFVKKQEEVLAEKYGAPYLEYKKMVKF